MVFCPLILLTSSGTCMAEPLTCPYCNTQVVPPAGARAGERVHCTRCGETFSLLRGLTPPAQEGTSTSAPAVADQLPVVPPPEPRRWPNALIAAIVVGCMMLLAAGVLQFALHTEAERRGNDFWPARPERVPVRFLLAMLTVLVSAAVTFILFRRHSEDRHPIGRSHLIGVGFLWASAAVTVAVLVLRGSRFEDDGAQIGRAHV